MLSRLKQHEVDLWEAWIEYDQFHPDQFGILYVIGEIMTSQQTESPSIKKRVGRGHELVLQVPAQSIGRSRAREVLYSEPIARLDQYSAISIYAGEELLARFDEIEVLI